jgi:membrane protease subunit (stomatin/prohibitin family)
VQAVGIASVSYDDESKKLINMRNQGAMLGDAAVREGYVQGAMARGFEAAGSNPGGSATAFMGMGMGMNAAGGFGTFSETNRAQMAQQKESAAAPKAAGWKCACGAENTGKFCAECGKPRPADEGWSCPKCGSRNSGKFCAECGTARPADDSWFCTECGTKNTGKFCAECGKKKD